MGTRNRVSLILPGRKCPLLPHFHGFDHFLTEFSSSGSFQKTSQNPSQRSIYPPSEKVCQNVQDLRFLSKSDHSEVARLPNIGGLCTPRTLRTPTRLIEKGTGPRVFDLKTSCPGRSREGPEGVRPGPGTVSQGGTGRTRIGPGLGAVDIKPDSGPWGRSGGPLRSLWDLGPRSAQGWAR